jgi:hypothetical protein
VAALALVLSACAAVATAVAAPAAQPAARAMPAGNAAPVTRPAAGGRDDRSGDGTIVSRAACTMPPDTYAAYRQRMHEAYRGDVGPAARGGLVLRPEAELDAALLPESEWRRRHRHEGQRCERIVYRSDGPSAPSWSDKPRRQARTIWRALRAC